MIVSAGGDGFFEHRSFVKSADIPMSSSHTQTQQLEHVGATENRNLNGANLLRFTLRPSPQLMKRIGFETIEQLPDAIARTCTLS